MDAPVGVVRAPALSHRKATLLRIGWIGTQYLYNASGQRIAKGHPTDGSANPVCPTNPANVSIDQSYVLGQGGEQLTQQDGSGQWQHTNVYAGGELIATYDQEGGQQLLHFNFSDALGTRRLQTSASGVPELAFSSLPFGDALGADGTGQDATEHHLTGKERDTESGLDYFGARYLSSSMGRWMTLQPGRAHRVP